MNPDACHGNKPNYIPKNEKRSQTAIRQQGFNEHAQGFSLRDNPWVLADEEFKLWEEGWKIREKQIDMFSRDDIDENVSFDSFAECPHCGMKVKVTLASE